MAFEKPPHRPLAKVVAAAVQRQADFRQCQVRRLGDQLQEPIVVRLDQMAAAVAAHLPRRHAPRRAPQAVDVADRARSDPKTFADQANRASGLPGRDNASAEIIRKRCGHGSLP